MACMQENYINTHYAKIPKKIDIFMNAWMDGGWTDGLGRVNIWLYYKSEEKNRMLRQNISFDCLVALAIAFEIEYRPKYHFKFDQIQRQRLIMGFARIRARAYVRTQMNAKTWRSLFYRCE